MNYDIVKKLNIIAKGFYENNLRDIVRRGVQMIGALGIGEKERLTKDIINMGAGEYDIDERKLKQLLIRKYGLDEANADLVARDQTRKISGGDAPSACRGVGSGQVPMVDSSGRKGQAHT